MHSRWNNPGLCLLFITWVGSVQAEKETGLAWSFNHVQDSFLLLADAGESSLRSTGLSTLGMTLESTSRHVSVLVDSLWINRDDPFTSVLQDFNGLSNIAAEQRVRLYHAVLNFGNSESRWSGSLGLQVLDDNFLIIEEAAQLVNSGFGMASALTGNTLAPTYPLSSPGTHLRYSQPDTGLSLALGLYDGNTGDENSNRHNTGISLNSDDGVLLIAEMGWSFAHDNSQGTLKLGGWHHTGDVLDYASGNTVSNNNAVYAIADGKLQYKRQRFGYFARFAFATPAEKNVLAHAIEAGFNWYGPLPSRPGDLLSIGVLWSHFGNDYIFFRDQDPPVSVQQDEWLLEASYQVKINDWLMLQPDLQWLNNPHNGRKNAVIAGLRIIIDF